MAPARSAPNLETGYGGDASSVAVWFLGLNELWWGIAY